MTHKFETAPYDKMACFATLTPFLILLGTGISLFLIHKVLMPPYLVILFFITLCPYLWAPRYYTVSDQSIVIKRLIGDVTIHRSSIKSLEIVDQAPIKLRLFGSGGLFGHFGVFTLTSGERAKLHCTRVNQVVVITTTRQIYIISPANPEEYVQAASPVAKIKKPK